MTASHDGSAGSAYGRDFFEHGSDEEGERLALIEEEQDPYTTARIQQLGLAADWHCLEVGAGKGSMARWLADQCPVGLVVATDLDVSLLGGDGGGSGDRTQGRTNLLIRQHDVTSDDFPADSFHLIHARSVLTHVPDRAAVIRRMVSWLRPGGWLFITDPASFPVDSSPHELMRKAGAASTAVMVQMIGTDPNWARSFPVPLVAAGLVDVDAECRLRMMRGGTTEAVMFGLMIGQIAPHMVATGLITDDEIAQLRDQLLDPSFFDFPPAVVRSWGRRP